MVDVRGLMIRVGRGVAVAVLVSVIGLMDASTSQAQVLDEVISSALSNGCATLGGSGGSYTGSLANLCNGGGNASAASAGSVSVQTRLGAGDEERRILQRLKEKREQARQATGAASADARTRGLSFWASGEYEKFDKDVTRFEPAYDSDQWGITVGADYRILPQLVLGIAGNYSHVDGDFDLGGGFDTDSYGGFVYGTVTPFPNFFVDLVAGYNRKDFSVSRNVSFVAAGVGPLSGTTKADTNGDEYRVGVLAGYDFIIRNLTIGPRVGVTYKYTTVDSFQERGTTGLELAYKDQHQTSLTTTLGVFASMAFSAGFGVLIPQATAEYLHEFEDDQRAIHFHFVGDLSRNPFRFQTDPPDRDYFKLGTGLVVVLPNGISPFVNYRALVGYRNESSHTVTAGVRFSF